MTINQPTVALSSDHVSNVTTSRRDGVLEGDSYRMRARFVSFAHRINGLPVPRPACRSQPYPRPEPHPESARPLEEPRPEPLEPAVQEPAREIEQSSRIWAEQEASNRMRARFVSHVHRINRLAVPTTRPLPPSARPEPRPLEEREKRIQELRNEDLVPAPLPSRTCRICFVEAPHRRAAFTSCGHISCLACAEQLDLDAVKASKSIECPFCRTKTGFVALFED